MHTQFPLQLQPGQALLLYVAICGIYVLTSYAYLLPKSIPHGETTLDALWFGIHGVERWVFYVSMLVAAFAFIIATIRFSRNLTWNEFPSLCVAYSLFLVGATIWTTSLWWFSLNTYVNLARIFVIFSLCLTTLGAVVLYREAWVVRKDLITAICIGLLCFHVAVFDNSRWAYAFLQNSQ
jgi:hypothetical protein